LILATFDYRERHKERTAAMLGISLKTLYNRLKEYRADPTQPAAE
jgi:two-component system response regulator AtoC